MTLHDNKALWLPWGELWTGNLALAADIISPDFVGYYVPMTGGDPADAFEVIVPSLPGFGFSTPLPNHPDMNFWEVADLWHTLMTSILGYEKYAAGGCDVGTLVTSQLGVPTFLPPVFPAKDSSRRFCLVFSPLSLEKMGFLSHLRRFY